MLPVDIHTRLDRSFLGLPGGVCVLEVDLRGFPLFLLFYISSSGCKEAVQLMHPSCFIVKPPAHRPLVCWFSVDLGSGNFDQADS